MVIEKNPQSMHLQKILLTTQTFYLAIAPKDVPLRSGTVNTQQMK